MKEARAASKRLRQVEYRKKNPEKFSQWVAANRPYYNEQKRLRKHAQTKATPSWSDPDICADLYTLASIYTEFLGEPVHVDHVVPLRSKLVCGLHTPANLTLLIAADNIRKGNRWWPEMP